MKKIKLYFILPFLMCLAVLACKDEESSGTAPDPIISATIAGYNLPSDSVKTEGNNVTIMLSAFAPDWKLTDLSNLPVLFKIKYGYLQNYENGTPNDFTKPVVIDVVDFLYNVRKYTVQVKTYIPPIPQLVVKPKSITDITLSASDVAINGTNIEIEVPTLTDKFTATDYKKLAITYDITNGDAADFKNGEALDYSNANGKNLTFKSITGENVVYNVKIVPVYVDKGFIVDPILTFAAINLNWQKVTTETLPTGLELYKVNDLKPGNATDKVSGYYAKLDLSASSQAKLAVGYTNGAVQNIKKWYTDAPTNDKPIIITNGGFFGGGSSYSVVIDNSAIKFNNIGVANRTLNGVSTPYLMTRSAFGINSDGSAEINWIYNSGGKTYTYDVPVRNAMNYTPLPSPMDAAFSSIRKEWKPVIAVGGAPVLIKNNEIVCTQTAEICDQFLGNRSRTAIGITADNKIILLVLDETPAPVKGFSLQDLAMIMKSLGCKDAMNLDGGGSSAMVVNGAIVNKPSDTTSEGDSRAIPTTVIIKKK